MTKQMKNLLFCFILLIEIFSLNLINCTESENVFINEVNFTSEKFISSDYIFNNEGLNKPISIQVNPVTKEFVVLDIGNVCIYVFSDKGKYKRKFGQRGQGPGDILNPHYMNIDKEGNIYIFEWDNRRLSIFTSEGKYINSFRIPNVAPETRFCISKDKEIIMNLPRRGYYFTVFSWEGEIIKEFGKIKEYIKNKPNKQLENTIFAYGHPIIDNLGNYYIFLKYFPMAMVFNNNGELLEEKFLGNILGSIKTKPPEEYGDDLTEVMSYTEVIFRNNKFYLSSGNYIDEKTKKYRIDVRVLDKNLSSMDKKIVLHLDKKIKFDIHRLLKLEVINFNEDIMFPDVNNGEILRFFSNYKP